MSQRTRRSSRGTMMVPPPPRKRALKTPAASPIRIRRTGRILEAVAAGTALLERLAAEPQRAGLFLDFDGVLAPIVARPEDAYPPPQAREGRQRLAHRYALVAVVSGRAGDDVRRRVGVDGVVCVGSHGLELDSRAEVWRARIDAFANEAGWNDTERKGLAVSFHYRRAEDEATAIAELERLAER